MTEAARPPAVNPRHVVDVKVLEMLVCPLTKTRLTLSADRTELISVAAHLAFPIRDGVPMLSLDEAREIDPEDMGQHRE
ncbi:Trm112 family protein [Devosia ginsengisoli]|uniref:Trm112 family protein n=1 Tax=Devosia ginsengisoli TaxID=400770 RepID=UPI0026EA67A7|nr:Trm112 family protein [Devosia ginsengisoli]MCR6671530.1 Trm112 family protein [Devosia ginsengisoli]